LAHPAAFSQLSQEYLGRHKERVLLQDSTDYDLGMRAHDVHNDVSAKLCKIIYADNRVLERHNIRTRLIFQQAVHAGSVFESPLQVRNKTNT